MGEAMVATAAVVMTGILLTVVAWQVLAIAKTAVGRDRGAPTELRDEVAQLRACLDELEGGSSSGGGAS